MGRLLQYLVGTPDLGLTFLSQEGVILFATWKSHSACSLNIGRDSRAFLSRSKRQTISSESLTVAEFIEEHLATKEIM